MSDTRLISLVLFSVLLGIGYARRNSVVAAPIFSVVGRGKNYCVCACVRACVRACVARLLNYL